ncbi:MAG: DUF1080 domain-containing protein [Verrucomicrobiota bacterium]
MNCHHLVLSSVFGILGLITLGAKGDNLGTAKEFLSAESLGDWEFISSTPTAMSAICIPGGDGILSIAGKPIGYLATKTSRENYQLHFEWRWPANAAKSSNGGVLIHVNSGPAGGTPWPACFQVQLKLEHAGDMIPMDSAHFAESLTSDAKPPLVARSGNSSEKPPGEWNTGDISCQGTSIEVRINGVLQNRVSQCAPASGKIAFQLEGAPFELRNVRIESNSGVPAARSTSTDGH